MYILMAYYCTRNQYGLCEARSMQRRSVYTTPKTRSVTSFFYFFSDFFETQMDFLHTETVTVSYLLLSFHWNTNVFILCEQRPSLISFSFISSLISLWNTDKFFFSCTETQLLLSLLFLLIFLYEKQIFLFLYRDHHLFHYLPFFWHYFMKYLSVNSSL